MRRALALAMLTALLSVPAPTQASDPVRILIVGDSVAHGSSGDWTWRYRLWRALADAGVAVDLVGPDDELHNLTDDPAGATAYADGAFDRDHAARWGMAIVDPDVPLGALVESFQPDVVVETRGLNDLTWFGRSPSELYDDVVAEIGQARSTASGVDFVLAGLPQVWFDKVSQYNALLPGLAADASTPGSQVVVAEPEPFIEGVDTWDPAHLSATGEVKYAAAVTDALAELNIGSPYPRPWPPVENGHWAPAYDVVATEQERAVRLAWSALPGAFEQYIWMRDLSRSTAWTRLPAPIRGRSWTVDGLDGARDYEFRLQSAKGSAISPGFSATVRVTPLSPLPPAPGPLRGLRVVSAPQELRLEWDATPDATSYDVSWTAADGSSGMLSVSAPTVTLSGLAPQIEHRITVTPRSGGGTGTPASATGVPLAGSLPPPVVPPAATDLTVQPGRHSLRVTWQGTPGTSYDVGLTGATTGDRGRCIVSETSVVYRELLAGETYTVSVTPHNGAGPGPTVQATGTPTGPRVAGPTDLRARRLDRQRVRVRWPARRHATTYEVAERRRGGWESLRTTPRLRTVVPVGPGPARLRVRSWHQRQPGGWSEVVRIAPARRQVRAGL